MLNFRGVYPIPLPPCLKIDCVWVVDKKWARFYGKTRLSPVISEGTPQACGCFRDEKRPGFFGGIMVMEPKYLSEEVSVHPNHSLTR